MEQRSHHPGHSHQVIAARNEAGLLLCGWRHEIRLLCRSRVSSKCILRKTRRFLSIRIQGKSQDCHKQTSDHIGLGRTRHGRWRRPVYSRKIPNRNRKNHPKHARNPNWSLSGRRKHVVDDEAPKAIDGQLSGIDWAAIDTRRPPVYGFGNPLCSVESTTRPGTGTRRGYTNERERKRRFYCQCPSILSRTNTDRSMRPSNSQRNFGTNVYRE
mmetsp:Transcript_14231/g.35711  ORF Transcript_14231/g.35711 Transcript_14231/m.35711 type:complete len:213 (-) Transcript_14231:613-1251(-)